MAWIDGGNCCNTYEWDLVSQRVYTMSTIKKVRKRVDDVDEENTVESNAAIRKHKTTTMLARTALVNLRTRISTRSCVHQCEGDAPGRWYSWHSIALDYYCHGMGARIVSGEFLRPSKNR
jgi:hypothetical protein